RLEHPDVLVVYEQLVRGRRDLEDILRERAACEQQAGRDRYEGSHVRIPLSGTRSRCYWCANRADSSNPARGKLARPNSAGGDGRTGCRFPSLIHSGREERNMRRLTSIVLAAAACCVTGPHLTAAD